MHRPEVVRTSTALPFRIPHSQSLLVGKEKESVFFCAFPSCRNMEYSLSLSAGQTWGTDLGKGVEEVCVPVCACACAWVRAPAYAYFMVPSHMRRLKAERRREGTERSWPTGIWGNKYWLLLLKLKTGPGKHSSPLLRDWVRPG